MRHRPLYLVPAALVMAGPSPAFATIYLSAQEAQQLLFPGGRFEALPLELTAEQSRAIEKRSGVNVRDRKLRVWKVEDRGWFFVDRVIGKHEFIIYAVGIDEQGRVAGIEVLEYRETYGDEIRRPEWRAQLVGKDVGAPLRLDVDVHNISGATLSCRHVADGVKRLLATHEVVLRDR